MLTILLFVLVSTACFYLGSRAVITRFLWSRYPGWLASFMDCAACSGFWYGLGLAIVWGQWRPLPFDLPLEAAPLVGLCSMVWTPFGAAMMQRSIDDVGTAVAPVGEPLDFPVEQIDRCALCDHTYSDHANPPRNEKVPAMACMRGTGHGSVCPCEGYNAG